MALLLEHVRLSGICLVDPNGGEDPSGCFPMCSRKTASVIDPKLSCLFS